MTNPTRTEILRLAALAHYTSLLASGDHDLSHSPAGDSDETPDCPACQRSGGFCRAHECDDPAPMTAVERALAGMLPLPARNAHVHPLFRPLINGALRAAR